MAGPASATTTPATSSWEDYLANEAKLAANRTNTGARPPREGHALCQGIICCGSCGRPMSTRYHRDGRGAYECHSRKDQQATPTCRSVSAARSTTSSPSGCWPR